MRYLLLIVFIVCILSLPLLIISTTVNGYTGSVALYDYGFIKYEISRVTGISLPELHEIAQKMIDYNNGKSDTPQLTVNTKDGRRPVYNAKELTHLADVRYIIDLFHTLQIASAVLFLVLGAVVYLTLGLRRLLRGLEIGAVITAAFTGALIVWALVDFDDLFYIFHLISFSNQLWLLDPAVDYLIMMFPEGFFNDAALFIVATIIGAAAVIWSVAFILRKKLPWKDDVVAGGGKTPLSAAG